MAEATDAGDPESEDSQELKTLRALTGEELKQVFKRSKHFRPCNICDAADWSVLGSSGAPSAIKLEAFEGEGAFGLAYALTCTNCGHIRLVNAKAVLANLRKDQRDEQ